MLRRNNKYVPDVLDCLANLSNDEVFTPPHVVNQMLDMLPQEVFDSKETTFLDPFTKSGVFLREITKRLLAHQVPDYVDLSSEIELLTKEAIQSAVKNGKLDLNDTDYEDKARAVGDAAIKNSPKALRYIAFEKELQDALDHILTKQVFGIAITELTANLSRRSLYCSKNAAGKYSVSGNAFGNVEEGNIRFVPMRHTWKNGSCIYCGASALNLDRPDEYESHAYEFIHRENLEEIFMGFQFTVVCGNPPYQLETNADTKQAKPIYHRFVEQAKRLNPRYLLMIIPSRWLSGGMGLDDFRNMMLTDNSISHIVDYSLSTECFPGVDIAGGVCYFLRQSNYNGNCHYTYIDQGKEIVSMRQLDEYEVFIRDSRALNIVHKVLLAKEDNITSLMSSLGVFGLSSSERGNSRTPTSYVLRSSDGYGYIEQSKVTSGLEYIGKYNVILGKATSAGAATAGKDGMRKVIATVELLPMNSVCTFSYFIAGSFDTEDLAKNYRQYLTTKFVRFLLLQSVASINLSKDKFRFVPMQNFSKPWTDAELYAKYNLTQEEIDFIESMIKPME